MVEGRSEVLPMIPSESRATSMRRPARVKPFFGSCQPWVYTADQWEARWGFQPFLLRNGFLVRAIPTADRRPAGGALCLRFLQQLPSPTGPTSIRTLLWSSRSGASWVFSIWNGCCRLGPELDIAVFQRLVPSASRSHPNSAIGVKPCQAAIFFRSCRKL